MSPPANDFQEFNLQKVKVFMDQKNYISISLNYSYIHLENLFQHFEELAIVFAPDK
jgi:hypothetical protein